VDPWADRREVRRRVAAKVADIEARIRALGAMRQALRALMARCESSGPVCERPILEALEGEALRSTV